MDKQFQYEQAWEPNKDHWFLKQTRRFLTEPSMYYYYENRPGLLKPEHFPSKNDQIGKAFIYEFGWTIPSEVLLGVLALYQPFVEIGCGTGFIAEICMRRNIFLYPTDKGDFAKEYGLNIYNAVRNSLNIDGSLAVKLACNSDSNLFLSWPYPELSGTDNQAWQDEIIPQMNPGQKLILVGEQRGCTGAIGLWDSVEDPKLCEYQTLEIPNFVGYYTQLFIITRK